MKQKNIFLYLGALSLFLLLGVSSCQKQEDNTLEVIKLEATTDLPEKQLFSKVEAVALECNDGEYLSDIDKLIPVGDYMAVSDRNNVIYVFTKDGKMISNSKNKIGHGPNEYSIVTAFTFNPYSKSVEILTPRDMLVYDVHFNLKNKVNLPTKMDPKGKDLLFFGGVYDLSEKKHVLIPSAVSKICTQVMLFDSSVAKIVKNSSFEEDAFKESNMQSQSFFSEGNKGLTFVPPFKTDYVYSFDKDNFSFVKKYQFERGAGALKKEDYKQFENDERKLLSFCLNTDKEIPVSSFDTSGNVVVVMKKGRKLSDWFTLFYDKSSKQVARVNQFTDKKMSFPLVKYADANCLYASVDGKVLDGILEHLNKQGIKVEANKQEKGSIYVLKYYLK